jgi:4-amino-4-deoxy-L-arabinose transferase-like glycosyltransferase
MKRLLILLLVCIAVRAILPIAFPFIGDEGLYAQEIDEMIRTGSLSTTYMGEYVPWKPPLTFYVHASFAKLVEPLNLPIEVAYRLPSYLFSILAVVAFYFLTRNFTENDDIAFVAALIFTTIPHLLVLNVLLMTDTLLICLLMVSLYFYTAPDSKQKPCNFLAGGLFAGLAFLTKTVAAFIVIPLAVGYYYLKDKAVLKQKIFLTSFLFIPLAMLLLATVFGQTWTTQHVIDIARASLGVGDLPYFLFVVSSNMAVFFAMLLPWLPFGLHILIDRRKRGFVKNNTLLFLLFWLLFFILPALVPGVLFWYFLPVIPAFIILVSYSLVEDRFDNASKVMLAALLLTSVMFSYLIAANFGNDPARETQRDAGMFLADKKGVAVVTYYSSGLLYYKFHNEKQPTYNETLVLFLAFPKNVPLQDLNAYLNEGKPLNSSLTIGYLEGLYQAGFAKPLAVHGNQSLGIRYVVLDSLVPDYQKIIDGDGNRFNLIYNNQRYYIYEKTA